MIINMIILDSLIELVYYAPWYCKGCFCGDRGYNAPLSRLVIV